MVKEKETYVCVEDRYEIDPRHQQIVSHIVLALYAGGSAKISADSDIGGTGHITKLFKTEKSNEIGEHQPRRENVSRGRNG